MEIIDNHGYIILKKLHFQNVFSAHETEKPAF